MPYLAPAAYAICLWWASTGVILLLNHLPARTFRFSMAGATLVLAAALWCIASLRQTDGSAAAYAGFTCGVLAWGWHEMSFFMGFVTGPRREAGPVVHGFRRFWHASETCLYHEAAIAITAAAIWLLSRGGAVPVAMETFLVLWVMRLSAKLNLFLGVRNLNEQFLPPRLRYLGAYLRHRRMNWLLPISVLGGAGAAAWIFAMGGTGHILVGSLLALAVVEHLVMVLPIRFDALWSAFMRCPAARVRVGATGRRVPRSKLSRTDQAALGRLLASALPQERS